MTAELAAFPPESGFATVQYAICLKGIVWREGLRFLHQRERFVAALVRPLVWVFIFAAGFRQVLGFSIIPPYDTYILYEVSIAKWATCARSLSVRCPDGFSSLEAHRRDSG